MSKEKQPLISNIELEDVQVRRHNRRRNTALIFLFVGSPVVAAIVFAVWKWGIKQDWLAAVQHAGIGGGIWALLSLLAFTANFMANCSSSPRPIKIWNEAITSFNGNPLYESQGTEGENLLYVEPTVYEFPESIAAPGQ